jgi:hypothetical protein
MSNRTYSTNIDKLKLPRSDRVQDDAVLAVTRWLALFIIPFLVVAATLLYVWPNNTGQTFAWTIKPSMTAMMLAAAYMGGIYFFARVAAVHQWHTIKAGFLPVTAFASLLGIATILHWDRFNHSHISFFTWAALYFTTPFLVILVWLANRSHDKHRAEPGDVLIPVTARVIIGVVGTVTLLVSGLLFLFPQMMIQAWPWTITPLTARVLGAMFTLPGLVGMGIAFEPRWSAARIILQSQCFSILMILIAAARAWGDFQPANPITWFFIGGLAGLLILLVLLYAGMELTRMRGRQL